MDLDPQKYLVFRRIDFENKYGRHSAHLARDIEVADAVVIRRQDMFASPCLLTYATMISMVAQNTQTKELREELMKIADYFHEQGVLAGEEGHKLPDL